MKLRDADGCLNWLAVLGLVGAVACLAAMWWFA